MIIVDSQIHVWAADSPARPWFPWQFGTALRPQPVTIEEILAVTGAAGVERTVLVPMGWDGDRNDLALAAAQSSPQHFAIMGRLNLSAPDARSRLSTWRQQPGMKGLRLSPGASTDSRAWLTAGSTDWLWSACEALNLPIMVHAPELLPLIGLIAERHPGLRLIIDHMALVHKAKDEAAFRHFPELIQLARQPNIAVKVSALPCYVTETYPFPKLQTFIRRVYDAFGPGRMCWGSDYGRLTCTYRENLNLFTEELPWLSGADKALVMGGALCRWIDWPLNSG